MQQFLRNPSLIFLNLVDHLNEADSGASPNSKGTHKRLVVLRRATIVAFWLKRGMRNAEAVMQHEPSGIS